MTHSTSADAELFAREAQDPHCLTHDQADELLRAASWRRFVVVGDSLAKGVGEPTDGYQDLSWAVRTANALRRAQPDLAYLNLGVENLRAAQVRAAQTDAALAVNPDLAAVVCGGNDIMASRFDPEAVAAELDAIMAALHGVGADIVTFTLQDISAAHPALADGPLIPRIVQLNEAVRDVAKQYDAIVVEMWSHPARSDADIYSRDLMHASMRGHAIVAAETIRQLGARLAAETAG